MDPQEKLAKLRAMVKEGLDDIEQGRYVEVALEDLETYIDSLGQPLEKISRPRE